MAKCFIILGQINKLMLLPLLLTVTQVGYILINKYFLKEQKYSILELLMISLGQISTRFIPCIIKISNEKYKENSKLTKKKKCLHYFILCLLCYINMFLGNFANILKLGQIVFMNNNLFPNDEFVLTISLEMFVLNAITVWVLKYKYFKHHIISLVVSLTFGMVSYMILIDFKFKNYIVLIIRCFQAVVEALYICYQKYMMEKFYYPYWNIALVSGIVIFFPSLCGIIIVNILKINIKSVSITSYFNNGNIGLNIIKLLLVFILHIIMSPLTILIIFYFRSNFILIVFLLTSIIQNIIDNSDNLNKLICIPFHLVQIFALLVYLEIIELNFCGLNKNTKRNIDLRAKEDLLDVGRDSTLDINCIDIDNDYGIEIPDKDENKIESDNNIKEEITEKIG